MKMVEHNNNTPWWNAKNGEATSTAESIEIGFDDGDVLIDGVPVSDEIRTPEVTEAASRVSVHPGVRQAMVAEQRRLIETGPYVAEGRDIGTVVAPDAPLKIFLTAFAVVDDIGGIMVIAAFYSKHVSLGYLAWAGVLLLMLFLIGKRVSTNKTFFMLIGIVIWYLFLQSGIHSTIAGVLLAFVIPARPRLDVGKYIERIRRTINMFPVTNEDEIVLTNRQIAMLKRVESASDRVISPLQSLEDNLHLAVNFVILPLFAFANAGVVFSGSGELIGDVTWAIAAGLLFGKLFGIYLFTWLAVKTGIAGMPRGMTWKTTAGVSLLGGIGFTVSLFITNLSFGEGQAVLLNQAKFGVLLGTLVAGMLGFLYLRWALAYDERKLKH